MIVKDLTGNFKGWSCDEGFHGEIFNDCVIANLPMMSVPTILHVTSPRWLVICSASQPIFGFTADDCDLWLHRGCALGRTDTASALGRCNNLPTPKVRYGQGRSDGGYIYPPKSVCLNFFMWLFCLLDPFIPTQIKFLATPLGMVR